MNSNAGHNSVWRRARVFSGICFVGILYEKMRCCDLTLPRFNWYTASTIIIYHLFFVFVQCAYVRWLLSRWDMGLWVGEKNAHGMDKNEKLDFPVLLFFRSVEMAITSSSWYQKINAGDSSGPNCIVHVRLIVEPFWT